MLVPTPMPGASLLFAQHHLHLLCSSKPKLLIQGTSDMFTSVCCFRALMACARYPKASHVVDGTGHFDLEYAPYSELHASLIEQFVRGSLADDERRGASGLNSYLPSLCTGGPCCVITVILALVLLITRAFGGGG